MMLHHGVRRLLVWVALIAALAPTGCAIPQLLGGMMQNEEYQKRIEVLADYDGLDDQTVAVVVVTDMATLYEYPDLALKISSGVSGRLAENVPGLHSKVLDPRYILQWQYRTPQWDALPYGEIAVQLNVDRVVFIDIYEYRLNPPGNYWQWEGVCGANIGIIEQDSIDPDMFATTYNIAVEFPGITGLGRESASAQQIETGLLADFIKKTSWLFYDHIEPKYPDKYRPQLETNS